MSIRYAIYFTPEVRSDLAEFGAAWLGWDSATGQDRDHPSAPGLDVATITKKPRKYGFHGTIKPPFFLAGGMTFEDLETAFRKLCAELPAAALPGLKLARLGRFMALVPDGPADNLAAIAARAVKELDAFRKPPSEDELARRRASNLSAAEEANLSQWGYPHVLDQFRFHLTLTGQLEADVAGMVERRLSPDIERLSLSPYKIDALTLLGSDAHGRFHQLHRVALSG